MRIKLTIIDVISRSTISYAANVMNIFCFNAAETVKFFSITLYFCVNNLEKKVKHIVFNSFYKKIYNYYKKWQRVIKFHYLKLPQI